MASSNLTFVTAYLNIYENSPPLQRTDEWRLNHFKKIAETGIQLCVYVTQDNQDALLDIAQQYPNIMVMDPIKLEDTFIVKACQEFEGTYTLPDARNMAKDTEKYLQLQSCKMEFVQDALAKNPWNSTHFAWIDFNIAYIFKNMVKSQRQLQILDKCNLSAEFFAMPGCWGQWDVKRHDHHMNHIHWRFCGGFFIADKASMFRFCEEYRVRFPEFLRLTNKLLWEVNVWAWIEHVSSKDVWNPRWYIADHNDLMIIIPNDLICVKLQNARTIKYNYPAVENYHPTSASYVFYKDKHWLNTRFVNYHLTSKSYYTYLDGTGIIKNKNLITELSKEDTILMPPSNLDQFLEMNAETIGLPALTPTGFSRGLEDIRLYVLNDKMRFIATTIEYSPTGRNRMVVGDYDPELAIYSNCKVVIPPNPDSWCEKNWVPIIRKNETSGQDEEWFIYKWSPMEIGQLVETDAVYENGDKAVQLVISLRYVITNIPWFDRFRGSTIFMENPQSPGNQLIGLAHFSEEGSPRHYFHSLVILDKTTLQPLQYSIPFYFQNVGVEFCTGIYFEQNEEKNNIYTFWISQMDRDPLLVVVEQSSIIMQMIE